MEHFAYCPTGIENFKANNQWFRKGSLPKNGNIIFLIGMVILSVITLGLLRK